MNKIELMKRCLDDYMAKNNLAFITPPDANAVLEKAGLLRDSKARRGAPLRILLRDGKFNNAVRDKEGWKIYPSNGR
ncbi:MAG: hypothetical protein K2J74_01990 [Muribaculaceae bacterium]|nr:hypothetical protein [Muribaculaceae bacterium]